MNSAPTPLNTYHIRTSLDKDPLEAKCVANDTNQFHVFQVLSPDAYKGRVLKIHEHDIIRELEQKPI